MDARGRRGPLISALFFTWFFAAGIWTLNALRRPVPPGHRFPPLWLPGMLISELAPLFFLERVLIAVLFIAAGALRLGIGQAGLVLFAVSQVGLLWVMGRSIIGARRTGHSPPISTFFRLWERLPDGVTRVTEVPYADGLTLDIYIGEVLGPAPTLLYVHPGSWMRGRPGRQARALFHRLARRGWVVLDIRYPLSPAATFPEHLIGVKRAIVWAKTGGAGYGVDPDRVVISGGSSGAHLAALAALTDANNDLQPGFEAADASVVACIPFYGIYDLLIRNPTRIDWPFIARYVLKAGADEAPDLYRLGSPIDQVHSGAPPFLVVHGGFDSIVLPEESRHFVTALQAAGVDARYLEVEGAQHGFDAVASLRTRAVANSCVDWLERTLVSGRSG
ncbi:MAG TPA: alpha/beta hydrolase [Acidimicrobiia bacterium]|nr:alpha/beta hydrolase [Acidimicrobiia bacterium]